MAEAVDVTTAAISHHKLLFAIHVYETVEPGSLAEVTARFPWSAMKVSTSTHQDKTPGCSLRHGAGSYPECCETAAYQAASTALVIAPFREQLHQMNFAEITSLAICAPPQHGRATPRGR